LKQQIETINIVLFIQFTALYRIKIICIIIYNINKSRKIAWNIISNYGQPTRGGPTVRMDAGMIALQCSIFTVSKYLQNPQNTGLHM